MIVSMHKYQFLVYHKDKESFMHKLMDLGLVQLVEKEKVDTETFHELSQTIKEISDIKRRLLKRKKKLNTFDKNDIPLPHTKEILDLEKQVEQKRHEAEALLIEINLLSPWGEIDNALIQRIAKKTGRNFYFFQYPIHQFKQEWLSQYNIQIVNTVKGNHYFVLIDFSLPDSFPLSPLSLPQEGINDLKQQYNDCLAQVNALNARLNEYAHKLNEKLEHKQNEIKDTLQLYSATCQWSDVLDGKLALIEAWCPQTVVKPLNSFLDKNQMLYLSQKAEKEDNAPVLLKNNAFTRLFEPIGNMFSLPAYAEMDLTLFFAPFFMLFFGLCLADAGYGVLMLIIGFVLRNKPNSETKDTGALAILFGISTIIAGLLSGTLFGIEMLKNESFSLLHPVMLTQDQVFELALFIGFGQIVFGMAIGAYKQYIFNGIVYSLSKIGWILLLLCLGDMYVTKLFAPVTGYLVWPALALIVVFNAPEKGWLKSIGFGLADLYNITGVLGDLLSYIRLFALGVSGAILGLVVNSIALSAKNVPYIGIVLFLLILIIGHGANLLLSGLSSFVHPMRLTFVEFYKNAGFTGGGKAFKAFKKNQTQIINNHT